MHKLAIALGIVLLTSGSAMANCYEIIGCTDEDVFRKSDLRTFSCSTLWELRNTIYFEHGYCFKTKRAINFFGNDECYIDDAEDIDFNSIEETNIARISSVEKQKGC
ncbi:MAG: YARHG domain-containing protein [Devosia sp.]